MHQRKSKKILIYFFLLFFVSSISNNFLHNLKLSTIQSINISGLEPNENKILYNRIKNLIKENIFFVNKNEIIKLINANSLIENYEVFKEYPSTININIQRTNFIARINKNGKIFLIGSNGKLTFSENTHKELPYIFGKPSTNEILKFKQIIDKSKFSYNQIDNLYFFSSKRWDIKLKGNTLLKLPTNVNHKTLDHLYEFLANYSGNNFTVVDYRLKNQIILNE